MQRETRKEATVYKQLILSIVLFSMTIGVGHVAAEGPRDPATWVPHEEDPVIKEL